MLVKLALDKKVLTFVGFCLPRYRFHFSYEKLREAIAEAGGGTYSVRTIHKEFSKLKTAGLIGNRLRYRKPIPCLTLAGQLKIAPRLSYKNYDNWDGQWRVVITNIAEKKVRHRQKLYSLLRELGFKQYRTGVYLSPHPVLSVINRQLTDWGISRSVLTLETESLVHPKAVAAKLWQPVEINRQYLALLRTTHLQQDSPWWPLTAKEFELSFARLYKEDPHLPLSLLPKNWAGEKAYELFKKIASSY